jgi:Tat protein secretion system quality control protein TatD with DNase activity
MGKKNRRNRSHGHDESDDEGDASSDHPHGDDSTTTNMKDLDFKQRQDLQRQQAAAKRRHKQKCHLCGQTGHVRRACPGILDDGRGMSRYKGKSDPQSTKARYETMQHEAKVKASGDAPPILAAVHGMAWPPGFETQQQQDQDHLLPFVYYDAGGDVQATFDYVKSGRGKAKMISQPEALHEYRAVMQHAQDTSNYGGMISRSLLQPNRPWRKPSALDSDSDSDMDDHEQESADGSNHANNKNDFNIWYTVGLSRKFLDQEDTSETTATATATTTAAIATSMVQVLAALMETYQQNTDCIAGFFCDLDFQQEVLKRPGCDRASQLRRLKCTCQAAGETNQTIAIRTSPGAAGLVESSSSSSEPSSVAGTPYAQVLLDLQQQLTEMFDQFPSLKIHLSCWSGRADHMTSIICQAFPFPKHQIYMGLDGSVSFAKATHLHECAFDCSLERLVLETSTVIPASVAHALKRDAFFHSATVPFLAQAVAKYKPMVSAAQVARVASQNTLILYPQLAFAFAPKANHHAAVGSQPTTTRTTINLKKVNVNGNQQQEQDVEGNVVFDEKE